MPFGESLSTAPVGQPAMYDPNAAQGSRWNHTGLSTSPIPRLYHSSALLLPDASVLIAGSNPNVDVNTSTIYPTTYQAEIFYPMYFFSSTRPAPSGIPSTVSYGGASFDISIPASSYSGSSNNAASNAIVSIIRPGFTTHAMNMGQRFLQLNHTYTVNSDGSLVLHVAQAPPNANLFQPGPALFFVTINGIPSTGVPVIVGSGAMETQPTSAAAALPTSINVDSATGSADGSSTSTGSSGGNNSGALIVQPVWTLGLLGAIAAIAFT